MTGRQWRTAALVLWFYFLVADCTPWFIDHWGMTWGVIAATVNGVLWGLVACIPLRDKHMPKSDVTPR